METAYNSSFTSRLQDPVYMQHLDQLEHGETTMGSGKMQVKDLSSPAPVMISKSIKTLPSVDRTPTSNRAMTPSSDSISRNKKVLTRSTKSPARQRVVDERVLQHIVEASFKHRGLTEHTMVTALCGMQNLTSLDASCNNIERWPFSDEFSSSPSSFSSSSLKRAGSSRSQSPSALARQQKSVQVPANSSRVHRPLSLLLTLDMSHNVLSSMGSLVGSLHSLIELRLSHNSLQNCEGISHCTSLSYLDLSHNNIHYIQGLETLSVLKVLNFSHNNIATLTDIRSLCFNTCLIDVDLTGNKKEIVEQSSVEDMPRTQQRQQQRSTGVRSINSDCGAPLSIITTTTVITTVSLLYEQYKLLLLDICPLLSTLDDQPVVQTNKNGRILSGGSGSSGTYHSTTKKLSSYSSQLARRTESGSCGTPVASYMRADSSGGSGSGVQVVNKPQVTHVYPRGLSVYQMPAAAPVSPCPRQPVPDSCAGTPDLYGRSQRSSSVQSSRDATSGEDNDVTLYYYNGSGKAARNDTASGDTAAAVAPVRASATPVSVWRQPPKYAPKGGYWTRNGGSVGSNSSTLGVSRDTSMSVNSSAPGLAGSPRGKRESFAPQTVSTSTTVSPSKTVSVVTRVDVTTVYARSGDKRGCRQGGIGGHSTQSSLVRKPFLANNPKDARVGDTCCPDVESELEASGGAHHRSRSVDTGVSRVAASSPHLGNSQCVEGVGTPERSRSACRGREPFFHASVAPRRDSNCRVVTPTLRGSRHAQRTVSPAAHRRIRSAHTPVAVTVSTEPISLIDNLAVLMSTHMHRSSPRAKAPSAVAIVPVSTTSSASTASAQRKTKASPSSGAAVAHPVISAEVSTESEVSPSGVNDSYLQQYLQSVRGGLSSPVPLATAVDEASLSPVAESVHVPILPEPALEYSLRQSVQSLQTLQSLASCQTFMTEPPPPYQPLGHGESPVHAEPSMGLSRLLPDYVSSPSLHMNKHKAPLEPGKRKPGIIDDFDISFDGSVGDSIDRGMTDGDADTDLDLPPYQSLSTGSDCAVEHVEQSSQPGLGIEIQIPGGNWKPISSQRMKKDPQHMDKSMGHAANSSTCSAGLEPFMVYNNKRNQGAKDNYRHMNNFSVNSEQELGWEGGVCDASTSGVESSGISELKTVPAQHNRVHDSCQFPCSLDMGVDVSLDMQQPPPPRHKPPMPTSTDVSSMKYTSSVINDDVNASTLSNISNISEPRVNSPFFEGH